MVNTEGEKEICEDRELSNKDVVKEYKKNCVKKYKSNAAYKKVRWIPIGPFLIKDYKFFNSSLAGSTPRSALRISSYIAFLLFWHALITLILLVTLP